MEPTSKELKSDSSSVKDIKSKKRNYSLTTNSFKNVQLSANSQNSKDNLNNNRHNIGKSSKRNNNRNSIEENHEINVISMTKYQENKIKNNIETLQKKYQKEIADIIKFELDKQLLNFKLNKEKEIFEKEYNNMNYKSLNNNNIILSIINQEKEKEKQKDESKEKNKPKKNELKLKEKYKENEELNLSPKPLKILDDKNLHENYYLMEHAKKLQIYEMNQIKKQKKLEKFEKLNKIKAEQMALKTRLESERANKNLQKNYYDLTMRKNNIENNILMKDLYIYQNKQKKNEKRETEIKENKKNEQAKLDHIKKLRLSEEKNRILLYLDLIKKEKSMEKKKLENIEIKQKMVSQYRELNNERKNNIKKLKKLIRHGIDEGNIDKFYSQFPENKEIEIVFENYKKERKEIENNNINKNKEKLYLNPLIKTSDDNINNINNINNDKMSRTSYEFRNNTIKIPKINLDRQYSTKNDNNDKNNNENNKDNQNINNEINDEKNKDKNNKIVNICSTKKDKSNLQDKYKENEKEIINNNNNQNVKENKKDNENEKSNQHDDINDNKKVLFETEIRDKIKEYKKERYQPFIKMLEKEKINEENRNLKLQNIKDDSERIQLEKQFGKE